MHKLLLKWDHWHIEPSSICALRCPRCPRAEVPESLLNRQLTLRFFQEQIGADVIKQVRKITFCGNDGDPIYCKELVEICQWIKTQNPGMHLVIVTNGSYKSGSWWQALAQVLDQQDEIHWSLDGWDQDSNQQYRMNSDWSSIMEGLTAFTGVNQQTYRVWAAIAFRFNQHQLTHMMHQAREHGMDLFQVTKSTKFGSHYPEAYGVTDPLCPDAELVSSSHRFERISTDLTGKIRPAQELKQIFWQRAQDLAAQRRYSGICLIGNKGVFVNSQGEFYPCCWTANRYAHNQSWHDLAGARFNLWQHTFEQVLEDPFWRTEFLEFSSQECRSKCGPDRIKDPEHTTEW